MTNPHREAASCVVGVARHRRKLSRSLSEVRWAKNGVRFGRGFDQFILIDARVDVGIQPHTGSRQAASWHRTRCRIMWRLHERYKMHSGPVIIQNGGHQLNNA